MNLRKNTVVIPTGSSRCIVPSCAPSTCSSGTAPSSLASVSVGGVFRTFAAADAGGVPHMNATHLRTALSNLGVAVNVPAAHQTVADLEKEPRGLDVGAFRKLVKALKAFSPPTPAAAGASAAG